MARILEQAYTQLKADPDYLGQILASPKKDTLVTLLFEEFARRQELPPQALVDALPREYRLRQLKALQGEEKVREPLAVLSEQAKKLQASGGIKKFPTVGGEVTEVMPKEITEGGIRQEFIEHAQKVLGMAEQTPVPELRTMEKLTPEERKRQREQEEAAVILTEGPDPTLERFRIWKEKHLPKGIRKPKGYETLKNQYQRDLIQLVQTNLEELSEEEWVDLQQKWHGKSKEEIRGVQQSLIDPTFMGHAGEFAKGFYKAHPAGTVARLLGVRPDVFQAAWDDVHTALHREAAIAGGVTGMAWSWGLIHQMINEAMVSPALKDAFKAMEAKKATPVDKQLVSEFLERRMVDLMYKHVEAKRLPNIIRQVGKTLEKRGWTKTVDPNIKVVIWRSPDGSMTFPNPEYWGTIVEGTKAPSALGMKLGAGGAKPPPSMPTEGPLVPAGGGAIDISKLVPEAPKIPVIPPTAPIVPVTPPITPAEVEPEAVGMGLEGVEIQGVKGHQWIVIDEQKVLADMGGHPIRWPRDRGHLGQRYLEALQHKYPEIGANLQLQWTGVTPEEYLYIVPAGVSPPVAEPTAISRPPTAAEEELHPEQLGERARQYPTLEEWMKPQIGDFVSFVGGPGMITGEGTIGTHIPGFKVNTAWGERIVPKSQAEVLNREGMSVGDLPAIWQEAQQTPPAEAVPTAKEPRNIIHEAMRLYNNKEFRPYVLPNERWVQAKAMAEQGKTEFEQASTDVILTMLQDKGQINKELLVDQFGEEAVNALVKDKFLQEKPSAKVEEPEAFRAGLPVRPAVMSLTPKAQEFLSMMEVAREIAPAKAVMSDADMTRLGEEDAGIIDEASFNIISGGGGEGGGGVTIPEPPGLPPEEKWRRRGANIIRIVDGYVSLERLHDLQARTGITITYNELDKAQLSGPAIPFIQEQLNLTAYPDLEREALDYVLAQVVPRGAHRTRVIGAKPDRIRRQLNKRWARQVIQREHQIHDGLQKIRGSLTPEAATERLGSDLMLEATNRGWIENQAGKIILTDQGIKRRQLLPELQKALHEVDKRNRKEAWIPAGQNITGLIMNKEGSGNLARFLVQNYTTTTDPITGDVYKTGRGLKPVIDDFLMKGGIRFHLVKYLTAKTVMDRVEFQNRPGNEQTIGPKLAKTAQDVVEAYERGNYPLLIETAKAIWPAQGERALSPEVMRSLFDNPTKTDAWNQLGWWGRVLKELRPSEEEFARLIDAHPHYVPLMVPKKGATTELDDLTSNLLQDLYENPTWGKSQRTPLYDFEGHGNIFLDPLESSIDLMNPYADFMLGREIQLDILDFVEKYPLWRQHFKEVPKMKKDTKDWAYIRMWDKDKNAHYFRIAPDFKQAMKLIQGIQPHIPNFVSKWIATPVRYLTRSVTTYNPLFPIWNFFKDQWHAWASLRTPYVPIVGILEGWTRLLVDQAQHAGLPTDFTEPMLASIMESYNVRGGLISRAGTIMGHEELRKAERGMAVLSKALHHMIEIARNPALKQAFVDDQTTQMPPSLRKQLRQQIQDAAITTAKEELATTAKGIGKVLALPFKVIAGMSEASEAATRMSTYATMRGRGASTLRSYIEHARAGVNFRRGQSTTLDLIVRAFIPFGMPNIIGKGTRIYKLTDPTERVGSWLRLGPLALIAALSTLFAMTTNEYKKLPYRKRLENIYFPIYKREKDPKTGKTKLKFKRLGRIPVGREDLGMIHATVVAMMNYLVCKDPEIFKILLQSIFRESFDWLGQILIAQLAFEWDAEYDLFFERHIVPESSRELPAQFQSNRYTSQVFKETAEGLARTFPFLEGQKWMKPAMLEHGFLTFTGNAGQNIWLPGGDWLLRQMGVPVDITRPKVDPIEVIPIAVRPGSIWSTQPVKSFRQDIQHLGSVQAVIRTRYKQYTNADQLSFDAKPEKPSAKTNIHYFDDLLVIIKGKTGEVVPYKRGMQFEPGDSLWIDENAIGSMTSRPKLLIHEFRQRPEIFMIYEQMLVTARWNQVELVADRYKKVLEASDRTVLSPDLTGRNPRDVNNIPFFNRYPQVADFYDYMAKKHPNIPIEDYGKIDPVTKTRTYISEWKREELQQLTDMAAVLAEIGHYEYQLLYRKGKLSQEKALSAVDASVVEYTKKWGDYNPMFETIIRTWLGQNVRPFEEKEKVEPELAPYPFMYNPATTPGITPKTGTELLLGENKP